MIAASKSFRAWVVRPTTLPSAATSFAIVSSVLFVPWIGFYLFDPFGYDSVVRDAWHHVAVLRELMVHPFAPSNPHIPTSEGSRYYTPISVLAAMIGRAVALSPYALFDYMGAITLVGLAGGCWSFGRKYFQSPWAPLLLLLSLLFSWGEPQPHAGFHNYATWIASASYPSSIALVFGLFLWTTALNVVERRSWAGLAFLAVFSGVLLLTHQLSGAIMLVGAGSFVWFHPRASIGDRAICLATIGTGCLATLAWPYFHIIDVLASTGDDRWKSIFEERNRFSTAVLAAVVPAVGIIGFRKPSGAFRLELIAPAALFLVAYLVLEVRGSPIAHRLPPAFIIFCQLGIVWLVLEHWERIWNSSSLRVCVLVVLAVLLFGSIAASVSACVRDLQYRSAFGSTLETAEQVGRFLPPDSVSFASDDFVYPLQSTGRRVVSIPRPEPAAPSLGERQKATDRFFRLQTTEAERLELMERWGARYVVFIPHHVSSALAAELRALGPSKMFQPGVEVVMLNKDISTRREDK